jgi:ribonuclease VapC
MTKRKIVLDASALIALIYQEKGKDVVEKHLEYAEISSVNLSEVAAYLVKKGFNENEIGVALGDLALTIINFDESQALIAARLIEKTSSKGLSLGDRACLALAIQRNLPVLTADKIWGSLDLGIKITIIR